MHAGMISTYFFAALNCFGDLPKTIILVSVEYNAVFLQSQILLDGSSGLLHLEKHKEIIESRQQQKKMANPCLISTSTLNLDIIISGSFFLKGQST